MKQRTPRFIVLTTLIAALIAVLIAVGQPVLASAATSSGTQTHWWTARHDGSWDISVSVGSNGWATPSYGASSHAQTCFNADAVDSAFYSVQLRWYDGGANKHLWQSPNQTDNTRVCSPIVRVTGKVYDRINVGCDKPIGCEVTGDWTIYTQ